MTGFRQCKTVLYAYSVQLKRTVFYRYDYYTCVFELRTKYKVFMDPGATLKVLENVRETISTGYF